MYSNTPHFHKQRNIRSSHTPELRLPQPPSAAMDGCPEALRDHDSNLSRAALPARVMFCAAQGPAEGYGGDRKILKQLKREDAVTCRHKLHYYAQAKEWSCGAAVLRMVVKSLLDRRLSERQARELLGTNKDGTDTGQLKLAARTFGLECRYRGRAPLSELRRLLREGYILAVSFRHPDDGQSHFGLVRSISRNAIAIVDPYPQSGPRCALPLTEFQWEDANGVVRSGGANGRGRRGELLAFRLPE